MAAGKLQGYGTTINVNIDMAEEGEIIYPPTRLCCIAGVMR